MSAPAELYCYLDSAFTGDLERVISPLRDEGYHVVVGQDLEEMTLLLQVSRPTAIIYTLATEGASLSSPFQTLARRALECSVPLILIGPGEPSDGYLLNYPEGARFDEQRIPADQLLETVTDLQQRPPREWFVPQGERANTERGRHLEERLLDVIADGTGEIQIETGIATDEGARITTTVSKSGAVLVREEQEVDLNDPGITEQMEAQHLAAVSSYAPAAPSSLGVIGTKFRGEVSAPFDIPEVKNDQTRDTRTSESILKIAIPTLLIAAALLAGLALFLSAFPSTPLPQAAAEHLTVD